MLYAAIHKHEYGSDAYLFDYSVPEDGINPLPPSGEELAALLKARGHTKLEFHTELEHELVAVYVKNPDYKKD